MIRAIAIAAVLLLLAVKSDAAIVYSDSIRSVFGGGAADTNTIDFDFNEDGSTDLSFLASLSQFHFIVSDPSSTSLVANSTSSGGPAPLSEGDFIGAYDEFDTLFLRPLSEGGGGLSFAFDSGGGVITGGAFLGLIAYMGFEFQADDGNHFGYILIRESGGGFGGFFLESGYETEPGLGLRAGAIPEPSVSAILVIGAAGLLFRRRRSYDLPL